MHDVWCLDKYRSIGRWCGLVDCRGLWESLTTPAVGSLQDTGMLIYLMAAHFSSIALYKPAQSRPANSERSALVPYPQSTEPSVGSVPWVVR